MRHHPPTLCVCAFAPACLPAVRFQEEEDASDYVTQLATDLHIYPPHHVLLGPYLHQEFDPDLVSQGYSLTRCSLPHGVPRGAGGGQ